MSMKLKICGMKDWDNILAVVEYKPDYLGFIFFKESPRYVGEDFQMPSLPEFVKKVGVFVNENPEAVLEKVEKYSLDYVQLHGRESVKDCDRFRFKGTGVIKVFSVDDEFDFSATKEYENAVDFFLFDTKGKYYGGNAQVFDWEKLKTYNYSVPFFLSGGLSLENIDKVKSLSGMNIHALDFNSGVELKPGVKDVKKVAQVRAILNYNT